MIHARRLQLLREIHDGQNRLTSGNSSAEHASAVAKLAEWQRLAERMDITLHASYTMTPRGPELHSASAVLSPSAVMLVKERAISRAGR
ncbi:MAG TPA: hypothetical protein VH763_11965 [Gemmatimonadales bacterium]